MSKKKVSKKRKRKAPRSKAALNNLANTHRAQREIATAEAEIRVLEKNLEKGLYAKINGLDVTRFWLSTPEARLRTAKQTGLLEKQPAHVRQLLTEAAKNYLKRRHSNA